MDSLTLPVTAAAAGWCAECIIISTSSGFRWLSVIAIEEASKAAGMWSSVCMWAGIAGELSGSCTLLSKIWLDAGECRPGEDERTRRGDAAMPAGYILGLPRGERPRGDVVRGGEGRRAGADVGDIVLLLLLMLAKGGVVVSRARASASFWFKLRILRFPLSKMPGCSPEMLASLVASGGMMRGYVGGFVL